MKASAISSIQTTFSPRQQQHLVQSSQLWHFNDSINLICHRQNIKMTDSRHGNITIRAAPPIRGYSVIMYKQFFTPISMLQQPPSNNILSSNQ